MRIYVASSWRNGSLSEIVETLRGAGHQVYDFREDDGDGAAFNWHDIDPDWQKWTPAEFRLYVRDDPRAAAGFKRDFGALWAAEGLLLVMPCGRSAHLELGCAIGAGKPTAILLSTGEPELMYRAVGRICVSLDEVLVYFKREEGTRRSLYKDAAGAITKKPY